MSTQLKQVLTAFAEVAEKIDGSDDSVGLQLDLV